MKIISINKKHTKDNCNVGFNVDIFPIKGATEEFNKKFLDFDISFDGEVLHVISKKGSIDAKTVDFINSNIAVAEEQVKKEINEAVSQRENMFTNLSSETNLEAK